MISNSLWESFLKSMPTFPVCCGITRAESSPDYHRVNRPEFFHGVFPVSDAQYHLTPPLKPEKDESHLCWVVIGSLCISQSLMPAVRRITEPLK